jgi:hypothetical protein
VLEIVDGQVGSAWKAGECLFYKREASFLCYASLPNFDIEVVLAFLFNSGVLASLFLLSLD